MTELIIVTLSCQRHAHEGDAADAPACQAAPSIRRTKRRPNRARAIGPTQHLQKAQSDIAFDAELIAVFPTETDDIFATTPAPIGAFGLRYLHVFPFSPRPDTPAARLPQLPGKIVMARASRLRQEGQIALDTFLTSEIALRRDVLAQSDGTRRTRQLATAALERPTVAVVIENDMIIGHDGNKVMGAPSLVDYQRLDVAPPGPEIEVRA